MRYITDLDEIFRMLDECCGSPKCISVGKDEDGCDIAIPCFTIGDGAATKAETKKGGAVNA